MHNHSELIKPDFLLHKKLPKNKNKNNNYYIYIIPSWILDLSSLSYCFYMESSSAPPKKTIYNFLFFIFFFVFGRAKLLERLQQVARKCIYEIRVCNVGFVTYD